MNSSKKTPTNQQSLKAAFAPGGSLGRAKAMPLWAFLPMQLSSTEGTSSGFRPELSSVKFDARLWIFSNFKTWPGI